MPLNPGDGGGGGKVKGSGGEGGRGIIAGDVGEEHSVETEAGITAGRPSDIGGEDVGPTGISAVMIEAGEW